MDDRKLSSFALLFTDIEGSTRLWEHSTEAMASAQVRHDQLLQQAIDANRGALITMVGDSLRASFPDVTHAVRAAVDAQIALDAADWNLTDGLHVRMAIHIASAERSSVDAFRMPEPGRLEAMLALAHGGQILLSGAAADSIRVSMPADMWLIDLGRCRLPGINRSERIVQIGHSALRSDFPLFGAPTTAGFAHRTHADRFIGRRHELAELQRLLDQPDIRLITLTGPGGIGKTRLVQELALELHAAGGLPVSFIELVGLSEASRVIATIASALQVQEFGYPSAIDALAGSLHDREMLVVLDNFEHLLGAADEIGALLSRVPRLRVVTTSRSPLRIRGEWQFPVEPLPTPPAISSTWEELDLSESVVLFSDRALSADPAFAVEARNATAVAQICRKLEGLPLAIELAAPLVRVLSLDELNARLDDRLSLLAREDGDPDNRHRAIRASIAWSYELLSTESQSFLRHLGVLQSGFTLETLDGLFGDRFDVLAQVELLVEQNLIHQGGFQRESDRFFVLESVRQFALERLETSGELGDMQQRHARYFSSLVLDRFPDQRDYDAEAVRQLRPVIDDLYQAILWTLDQDPERALAIAAGAWRLWFVVGQLQAADQWLGRVLDATADWQTVERVRAIYGQSLTLFAKATAPASIALSERSLALAETIGDLRGVGDACNYMAGMIAESQGDFARAGELIDRALVAYEAAGDRHGWAESLLNRASLHYELGRLDASLEDGERLLAYCRTEGKDVLASNSIHGVAGIAFFAGQPERTRLLLIEGFELSRRLGYDVFLGANISVLGMLLTSTGRQEDALRLSEFGVTFANTAPGASGVSDPFRQNERERELQLSSLSPEVAERAIAAGRRMTPAEAVDQALALLRSDQENPPSTA